MYDIKLLEIEKRKFNKIISVLLALEAKLRKDQKSVTEQLLEKDKTIKELESSTLCMNCKTTWKETKSVQTDFKLCDNNEKYVLDIELSHHVENDDYWYESEGSDSTSSKRIPHLTNNEANNPVLECVNQIIIQQTMDNCFENNVNRTKENAILQSKFMQLSIEDKKQKETTKVQSDSLKNAHLTNEYELIESFDSCLNSESKDPKFWDIRKTPPVLPPKPANLIKLQQISKRKKSLHNIETFKSNADSSESEPDNLYCSIKEVLETSKHVKSVAEIHEAVSINQHTNAEITALKMLDESFSDVPKLPNVAEIISPKTIHKVLNQANYIKKKSLLLPKNKTQLYVDKRRPVVNNKKDTINAYISVIDCHDKNRLSAEFEFFNLDAEYDKKNLNKIRLDDYEEKSGPNFRIEYNLDAEFRLNSDIF